MAYPIDQRLPAGTQIIHLKTLEVEVEIIESVSLEYDWLCRTGP